MTTSNAADALNATFVSTPLDKVVAIAADHFDIDGRATVLTSEKDETFLLEAVSGARYILKIANPAESLDVLRFQTNALLHLEAGEISLPLPRVIMDRSGSPLVALPFEEGIRTVRVLTFVDGIQLHRTPRSRRQMQSLGTSLALLGRGLADYRPDIPAQDLLWDISNAEKLRDLLPMVGEERRPLALRALDGFSGMPADIRSALRRQVIHNDFNPHNILMAAGDTDRLSGVIDFGDMVEAALINDLAVALSYQVAAAEDLGNAVDLLAAYHAARPLDAVELIALPTLLRTRLAMTVVITEWRAALYPENRDYILRNHPTAVAGLLRLKDFSDPELTAFFREKIGAPT